jgi:hypothetical protein
MKGKRIPQDWNRAISVKKFPENRCSSFSVELRQFDLISNLFEDVVSGGSYDRTTRERYTRESTASVTRSFADEENIVAVFQQVMKKQFEISEYVRVSILIEDDS